MKQYFKIILWSGVMAVGAMGSNLRDIHTWCCGPSAPGGCDYIDVDAGLFCIVSRPEPCDPQGNETYPIIQTRTGTMVFGKQSVPFIEFTAERNDDRIFYRIYQPEVPDGKAGQTYLTHHAETSRYRGKGQFDPTKPFQHWEEVRCDGK